MNAVIDSEKNWYKITTIILSIVMVVLTFISVILYRYLDKRKTNMEIISQKIGEFTKREDILSCIPKVDVLTMTLNESGFPETAFSSFPTVPAIVLIEHVGGETAKGITVSIISVRLSQSEA